MDKLIAKTEQFRKTAEKLQKQDKTYVWYIHPLLITIQTHKCYTWKQLRMKIQHNKNVKRLREYFNIK